MTQAATPLRTRLNEFGAAKSCDEERQAAFYFIPFLFLSNVDVRPGLVSCSGSRIHTRKSQKAKEIVDKSPFGVACIYGTDPLEPNAIGKTLILKNPFKYQPYPETPPPSPALQPANHDEQQGTGIVASNVFELHEQLIHFSFLTRRR